MVFICVPSTELFFFNRNFVAESSKRCFTVLGFHSYHPYPFFCKLFSQQYSALFLMPSISSAVLGRGKPSAKQRVNRLHAFSIVTGTYVFSEEFICQKKSSLRFQVNFW